VEPQYLGSKELELQMLRSPCFLWSKSRAYTPKPMHNSCDLTHPYLSSITDLLVHDRHTPTLDCSRSPREKRRGLSDELSVSHFRPLPSVVRYRLKNYWKRRQVSVTHHRPRLIQAFVNVRITRRLMAVYTYLLLPEAPKDANVTVLALIAPRVGNVGYRGRCR
jgi:hypothetical protein